MQNHQWRYPVPWGNLTHPQMIPMLPLTLFNEETVIATAGVGWGGMGWGAKEAGTRCACHLQSGQGEGELEEGATSDRRINQSMPPHLIVCPPPPAGLPLSSDERLMQQCQQSLGQQQQQRQGRLRWHASGQWHGRQQSQPSDQHLAG